MFFLGDNFFIMIMDDILGMSLSDITDNDFPFETEIEEAKNMDMVIPDINLNLEELEFDFEDMQNFGPWIEADIDVNNIEPEPTKPEALSERLNFKDLEIEEAVRYDCMWSSYNEFNADNSSSKVSNNSKSTPLKSASTTVTSSSPNLNLSNSFYDSLLNSFETPSCTESDNTSERSSDMDTDTEDSEASDKAQIYTNIRDIENKNLDRESSIRLFASMDHCYNISSTQLDNEKFLTQSPSGPLTPPMSSDDEESSDKHRTNFNFDQQTKTSQQNNKNKCTFIRTKASNAAGANNIKSSQSLLKKSYTKSSPEAKFSFKLNLNDTKSRSLLKQRIQKVKIIKAPGVKSSDKQKTKGEKANKVQSAIRKRKERSLKMQEGEAREMHNQMERQRRNELKLSFDKLKTVLPELATSDKASKQQILDKAVDAVNMFKSTEASLAIRRNNLSKSNALLQEKLRLLKQDILKSDKYNMGIDKW